jgi:hypothetical protein
MEGVVKEETKKGRREGAAKESSKMRAGQELRKRRLTHCR